MPYTVAVRTLCEFAAKRGDLDLRFTPSPTSQQGIAGHRAVLSRRSQDYQREVAVSGEYRELIVRGRADGYWPEARCVEEVKTFVGDFDRIPDNHRALHLAQAKVYGALLCRQLALAEITVALVYFNIRTSEELPAQAERYSAQTLIRFFEDLCGPFLAWAERETSHRRLRDEALTALQFPFPSFRSGQRDLAKSVYNAARAGRCVLAQAPTGIGKTLGTLFPLLKACPSEQLDKVFFLTAKGSGRALVHEALEAFRANAPGWPLRTLHLIARDKACEYPDKECHGDSCPLAKGFYDRLPAARSQAADAATLTHARLREIARAHHVCPYYLGQEMARWCDLVVADYHYYFDATALLFALTRENAWRVGVLADEAHNLLERTRAMYSARLTTTQLRDARGKAGPLGKRALSRVLRQLSRLASGATESYTALDTLPKALASALRDTADSLTEQLAEPGAVVSDELLRCHFDLLAFLRLWEDIGAHAIIDVVQESVGASASRPITQVTLSIRNVLPARYLAPRFAAAHMSALFSATLTPAQFYIDTLGLPDTTAYIDITAPFTPGQLAVRTHHVSTRFRDREASCSPIVDIIAAQYERRRGNYIAYASSFVYLEQLVDSFARKYRDVPCWRQTPGMTDTERDDFLRRFAFDGAGVGFAVLGGAFAEGIDLVGTRLIGVFIATLGLPQWNDVNDHIRRRLERVFGAGYEYAYLYPGIRKVVQAAGRVIRSEADRGVVHLIDDRFARPEIRRLLPQWWDVKARPHVVASVALDEAAASAVFKGMS